uniref:Reverse transcriptase domain-containing protein n=1 Tax=Fagus sylvatica TaxID=28930 RepID=A0A2N9GDN4_FAGSY
MGTTWKGPPTPRDDNQPPPQRESKMDDLEADSRQVTRHRDDEEQKTPSPNRHSEESAELDDKTTRLEEELHEMKKQMGDMKNSLKAKAARNLDNLVHRADSPFIPRIANFPLPSRFKVPLLENFNKTKEPFDYLEAFKTIMQLQAVPEEIMCQAFPMGLRGRPPTHLLNVKQMEGESLRAYMHRFNKEAMQIDRPKEDVTLTAFMAGLRKGDFLYNLCKDPPETLSELMYEAQKHMNAEDVLESRNDPPPKRQKDVEDRKQEPAKQKVLKFSETPERKRMTAPSVKFNSFTPLNTPINQLLMQIQDDPSLRWPGKIRSDPDSWPKNLYCRYHRDHGHLTENYLALKEQVKTLIRQGKLQKYVSRPPTARPPKPQGPKERIENPKPGLAGEIKTIVEGPTIGGTSRTSRKAYARQTLEELINLMMTHFVITMNIADFTTRRVMIDNGSSADILYLPAYQQMKLDKEKLRPMGIPLVGFTGDKICPVGIITLPITIDTYPKQVSKTVDFLVVDCPSVYNTIIGQPTLNRLRAMTSTYHFLIKFPTEHRNRRSHRRPNSGQRVLSRFIRDGGRKSDDYHRRAKNPGRTKQRIFALERKNAIMEEVDKLFTANFIKEVFYPDWLANVVMVKKAIGKWRMCVDFTDLNKACPKDSFPLPRIDQLVDSTAGHKLLTFIDAFSGYNQIVMDETDQEKTSFTTSKGLFCYKVMPFGLKNAGATYQRLMNRMFHDQLGKNVKVYIDDMLVKSKKEDDHLKDLEETFKTLHKYQMKLNPSKCAFGVSSDKFIGFMVSQKCIEANPNKIKVILEMQPPRNIKETQGLTGRIAALNRFVSRSTDKCLPFFKALRKAFEWTDECQQAFEQLKKYLATPSLLSPFKPGEELYLYLLVSRTAINSTLLREEEGQQLPIYYTSRALRGVEERYSPMEKLAFTLVTAVRKLRPYFQAHTIVLLTNHPLRKAMNKPDAAGRLIQWPIDLSEFDVNYRPQTVIKAQALADFIAEFTTKDDEPKEDDEQTSRWTANIDGSSTKNAGRIGIILESPEGGIIK